MAEDPGEFKNLINEPEAKDILMDLKEILYSQVDPEEVTLRAFRTQEHKLQDMINKMSEEELVAYFKRGMGDGHERVMAAICERK